MRRDEHQVEQVEPGARVPLAEEQVSIGRREVVTGRVRVTTRVEAHERLVEAQLDDDVVDIVRVPIDREVEEAPAVRVEGDVTIVPIVEEVAVVETRLVLREELHLRRRRETRSVSIPVTLRRQTAHVERSPAPPDADASPAAEHPHDGGPEQGSRPRAALDPTLHPENQQED